MTAWQEGQPDMRAKYGGDMGSGHRRYTEDQMLAMIRHASERHDYGPIAHKLYDAERFQHEVSAVRIMQVFGSWNEACRKAGVPIHSSTRTRYGSRWTVPDCIAAVLTVAAEVAPLRVTYRRYEDVAQSGRFFIERTGEPIPSGQTVRNITGLKWSEIRQLAGLCR